MSEAASLQGVSELPSDYRAQLEQMNLLPAWTLLRAVMPVGSPAQRAHATLWRYAALRPLLMRAAEVVPMERAERRVLAYVNPGLDRDRLATMPSIFFGLQLIMPGERAPNHRHIPAAARLVVEGEGAYTTVQGEKLHMEEGDLILTPPLQWHDHGHEGSEPVVWMDVLDHPLAVPLDVSYMTPGTLAEGYNEQLDTGDTWHSCPGIVPHRGAGKLPPPYPMRRYKWSRVRAALLASAEVAGREEAVHLRYCNPETGESALKTLEFSARCLRAGETLVLRRSSANQVFQVMEGSVEIRINNEVFRAAKNDTVAAPTYASIELQNSSSTTSLLLQVDDTPTQIKLGFYEEWA